MNFNFDKFWRDPVWSAVIAALISGGLIGLVPYIHAEWPKFLIGIALISLGLAWWKISKLPRLQVEMKVEMDENLPHAPIIRLEFSNSGSKPIYVVSAEFVTKENWAIPDPVRSGTMQPVVNFLPKGEKFIKVSSQKNSAANKAIDLTLEPKKSSSMSFRLITDEMPFSGLGLFPFYLEVSLIYGENGDLRIPLPDIIVSLHGGLSVSYVQFGGPQPLTIKPSDLKNLANIVLSKVNKKVLCPPEILKILRSVTK